MKIKQFFGSIAFICFWLSALAQVRLPSFFSDHMVLQRQQPIPVWGWAKPGEKVTVSLHNKSVATKADKAGKWQVQLPAEEAGGPYTLIIKGSNTISIGDVLIGDVWLCSGQSNMEWSVAQSMNSKEEIAAANYPNIRHFKVNRTVATLPQEDAAGSGWKPATPGFVGQFTGVGYYFARHLQKELNVPIGLLNTSWGGTHVETWTSREAFESEPEFNAMINRLSVDYMEGQKQSKDKAQNELQKSLELRKALSGPVEDWPKVTYTAADWSLMNVPGLWEQQGMAGLDGVVWMRREFELTGTQAAAATLYLGMIDDNDITWVNGTKAGETNGYNIDRVYKLPAGLLKPGRNVIALRIDDTGGGGGLYSKEEEVYLSFADGSKLPLAGKWKVNLEKVYSSAANAMGPNDYPTLLYNAMLHPLIPFGIRGAIWYQGESNTGRAVQYRKAFPLMINDWRKRWAQGDFPFYFVQLATYFADAGGNKNSGNEWAELREAQTMTLSLPNTGMAVTTDIGNPKDIHPTNKQEVGRRLALQALQQTYGQSTLVASGPVLDKAVFESNRSILHFNHTGSGLTTTDKYGYLYEFELAGSDGQWHFARAWIEGNTVVVQSEKVPNPVAARYNWTDNAEAGNLFNKEGLPAAPFRTDNWKRSTEGKRFME